MVDVNWGKALVGVDEALKYFESLGVKPTLRTLFYNLYSKALIPNTRSAYQGLSKQLVKARKEGRYEWDFLEDKTRVAYGSLEDARFEDDVVETFEKRLVDKLERFDMESILREYFDYLRPWCTVLRWADQPLVCEIWIEKEALASTLQNWVGNWGLTIRVNRGYSSWTFIYNNVEALKYILQKHQKVVIYYLGDLDPSGVDIERFLNEALEYFGLDLDQVELKRLGVTSEQVTKYNLPPKPEDAETLAKLERDPRMATYEHSFIVELDALVAYVPEEFRRLVSEAIRSVWDDEIYQKLHDEALEKDVETKKLLEECKEKAREKMRHLLNGEDKDDEERY